MIFLDFIGLPGYLSFLSYFDLDQYKVLATTSRQAGGQLSSEEMVALYQGRELASYIHQFVTLYRRPYVEETYGLPPAFHRYIIANPDDKYPLPGSAFSTNMGHPEHTKTPLPQVQLEALRCSPFFPLSYIFSDLTSPPDMKRMALQILRIRTRNSIFLLQHPNVLCLTTAAKVLPKLSQFPTMRQTLRVADTHLLRWPQIIPHLSDFSPLKHRPAVRLMGVGPAPLDQPTAISRHLYAGDHKTELELMNQEISSLLEEPPIRMSLIEQYVGYSAIVLPVAERRQLFRDYIMALVSD